MNEFKNLNNLHDMLREAGENTTVNALTRKAREEKIRGIFKASNNPRAEWLITESDAVSYVDSVKKIT
jgi:hypothetical protein